MIRCGGCCLSNSGFRVLAVVRTHLSCDEKTYIDKQTMSTSVILTLRKTDVDIVSCILFN